MACSGCDRLRKELDELKDSNQLKEFELDEKLNHLEDRLEWAKQDEENLKGELEDTKKELERYKALVKSLGLDADGLAPPQTPQLSGGDPSAAGAGQPKANHAAKLLEIIKKQAEMLEEMKALLIADVQTMQ